jgi:hypothetical protein
VDRFTAIAETRAQDAAAVDQRSAAVDAWAPMRCAEGVAEFASYPAQTGAAACARPDCAAMRA